MQRWSANVTRPEPEVWLRGPVPGVPPLLQPAAHSLLQCREEVASTIVGLTADEIARRLHGAATIGFHVRHAIGSLDRLFTYARGEQLSDAQRAALAAEGATDVAPVADVDLIAAFDEAVERALRQLRATPESTLLDARGVGRAQLPSTVLGLLFHAAEHTQRHVGQAVTTARMIRTSATGVPDALQAHLPPRSSRP
ncbi:MAG: DinB family protein [Gemmatimonadaceae bacterium]